MSYPYGQWPGGVYPQGQTMYGNPIGGYGSQQGQIMLPQQQVLRANGRASVDGLRMAPNSSVYIEDATDAKILYKCVSDGLGNVTITVLDTTIHEDAPIIGTEDLLAIVGGLNDRLTKLEETANARENTKSTADRRNQPKNARAESSE